jgi:hypothetical protein
VKDIKYVAEEVSKEIGALIPMSRQRWLTGVAKQSTSSVTLCSQWMKCPRRLLNKISPACPCGEEELGDLSKEIDGEVKKVATAFCGKMSYQVGDLTVEIDRRAKKSKSGYLFRACY